MSAATCRRFRFDARSHSGDKSDKSPHFKRAGRLQLTKAAPEATPLLIGIPRAALLDLSLLIAPA